ncbi:MAG: hypothetical protein WAM97_05695, partial [Acidimicrobiales bacterium]
MAFRRRRHEQDHQQAPDARAHLDAVGSEPVESDAGEEEPLSVQSVLETDITDVVTAVGSYLDSP